MELSFDPNKDLVAEISAVPLSCTYPVYLAEKMVDLGTLKTATMDDDAQTRTWITWDLGMIPSDEIYSFACSGEMFELESLHILYNGIFLLLPLVFYCSVEKWRNYWLS
nr:hypothetical protein Iba_chr11fCG6370 [Ipomoea batatas]